MEISFISSKYNLKNVENTSKTVDQKQFTKNNEFNVYLWHVGIILIKLREISSEFFK